ncbi:MAG: amidohydrolase family protein [Flavobacteriaceae bacterium]|nr:amidohydrolase family protein [Flavobacteriaceae bacterium]
MTKKFFFLLIFIFAIQVSAQDIYLHCGKLIDTKNGKVLKEKTIVISADRITKVVDGYLTPSNPLDKVIDLKNKTVLPGLVDMHVHVEGETNPNRYLERFTLNDADVALRATTFIKTTLMAGFTTVRDMGGSGVNVSLRNAVNKGYVEGSRIFTAEKSLATTGGHADPTNGTKSELMGDPGPKEGVVNSVEDGRKAVRQRYKNGADWIKITATGGVLSVAKSGQNPQFTVEEIKAITETAKDYGMYVAAHAHGDEGMQRAILGGVKTIEHGTLMSEATMDLMIKNDVYLVPTIIAGKEVGKNARIPGYFPAIIVPKALEMESKMQQTFAKAYKKGVKIAFGTDAGVFPHGINAQEFGYMVAAGMPAMEAIQSATVTPAFLLNQTENLGSIEVGKLADIIATDEDPTQNVKTLEHVVFVMKDGKIYKD